MLALDALGLTEVASDAVATLFAQIMLVNTKFAWEIELFLATCWGSHSYDIQICWR